jgi:hypothetical protein
METNRSIRASILPGMWSTSLDLTDAYFHCPISVAFRKYLRFVWDNNVFQFRASCDGMTSDFFQEIRKPSSRRRSITVWV